VKQVIFLGVRRIFKKKMQLANYQRVGRWAWTFYALSMLLLFYTVLPFTHVPRGDQRPFRVPETNGAYAWINFVFLRLQPAELMKIAFVLVLARYLRFRSNYRTLGGLLPPFALSLAPVALILAQCFALLASLRLGLTPDNPSASGTVNRVVAGVTIHPYTGQPS